MTKFASATHNTLPSEICLKSSDTLNLHLSAALDLHAQLKQAHWNVRGKGFFGVHSLLDSIAAKVEDYSDMIAERIGFMDQTAQGTLAVAAERSFLVPYTLGLADEKQHLFAIASALAAFAQSVRKAVTDLTKDDDVAAADLMTDILRGIEQQLWFVESHRELT